MEADTHTILINNIQSNVYLNSQSIKLTQKVVFQKNVLVTHIKVSSSLQCLIKEYVNTKLPMLTFGNCLYMICCLLYPLNVMSFMLLLFCMILMKATRQNMVALYTKKCSHLLTLVTCQSLILNASAHVLGSPG